MLYTKINKILPTRSIALTLIFFTVVTPLLAQQRSEDFMQGKIDGERDAKGNFLWFLGAFIPGTVGICFSGVGCGTAAAVVTSAYLFKPDPSPIILMGKSPEYVMGYTEGYGNKSRNQNTMYAAAGCLIGSIVNLVIVFWALGINTQ